MFVKERNGKCAEKCQGTRGIKPVKFTNFPLPRERHSVKVGTKCMQKCPSNLVLVADPTQGETCSRYCPSSLHQNESSVFDLVNNEVKCSSSWNDGYGYGIGKYSAAGPFTDSKYSHFRCSKPADQCDMYNYYRGKRHIEGPVIIGEFSVKTFKKYPKTRDVFHSLETITGYLEVDFGGMELKGVDSLGFLFPNLKTIGGLGKTKIDPTYQTTMASMMIEQTSGIRYLGLNKLKTIFHGTIWLQKNKNLCVPSNFDKIMKNQGYDPIIEKNNSTCTYECHEECSSSCWMPNNNEACLSCKNFHFPSANICTPNCETIGKLPLYDVSGGISNSKICCSAYDSQLGNKKCLEPGCESSQYRNENGFCFDCNRLCNKCTNEAETFTVGNKSYPVFNKASCTECDKIVAKKKNQETIFICVDTATCEAEAGFMGLSKTIISNGFYEKIFGVSSYDGSTELCEPKSIIALLSILTLIVILSVLLPLVLHYYRKYMRKRAEHKVLTTAKIIPEDQKKSRLPANNYDLPIIEKSNLKIYEAIGEGAYGQVFRAELTQRVDNEDCKIQVAVKVFKGMGESEIDEFFSEATTWCMCFHANLVKLFGICITEKPMLICQYMKYGSLKEYLVKTPKQRFKTRQIMNWLSQVADGMSYLEDRKIVHRDLAARNILLQELDSIKISDFGLSKVCDVKEGEKKIFVEGNDKEKMPVRWLAPEVWVNHQYTHATDIWSFGVTMWEILTFGKTPYTSYLHT